MSVSTIIVDWMAASSIIGDAPVAGPIVNSPNGPYAAGTSVIYTGQIVDPTNVGIPAASLLTLTLTLVDTATMSVVNNVSQTNILNTGRGVVDSQGNLTITLLPGDTSLANTSANQVQRSMIIDWTYGSPTVYSGRHQVNLILVALSGA